MSRPGRGGRGAGPLWVRLSLVFGLLLVACFAASAWLQMRLSMRETQRTEQRLMQRLAEPGVGGAHAGSPLGPGARASMPMADPMAGPAAYDSALRVALWSVGLVAPLGALAGVAAFRLVTRPLSALTRAVDAAEHASRQAADAPVRGPPAAAPPADEIAALRAAFERLTATNHAQWVRLSRQDRQRRELVANISHDLRTPLASLHGYLETLLLKSGQLGPAERDRYLRTALSQSQRVGRLADALLELAKYELGTVRPRVEAFSLVDLTLDVVQKLALAAQARGQQLQPDVPAALPAVVADIGMIERVLTNLLDNAIHHAPEGGRVRVQLSRRGDRVHVAVADTGPGLPAAVRERLFDPADAAEASHAADTPTPAAAVGEGTTLPSRGGNGLGLLIVRQVLRLHGSEIRLEPEPGYGCVLAFDLPVATRPATPPS